MKKFALLLLAVLLLAAVAGCTPKSPFAGTPMDASVFEVLDADTQVFFENFENAPPVSMVIRYDQHFDDVTVEDAALIMQMYKAISKIRVTAKTEISSTDGYHMVAFTAADGAVYSLGFENSVLCENGERYVLDNTKEFWALFKSTAEEYSNE